MFNARTKSGKLNNFATFEFKIVLFICFCMSDYVTFTFYVFAVYILRKKTQFKYICEVHMHMH